MLSKETRRIIAYLFRKRHATRSSGSSAGGISPSGNTIIRALSDVVTRGVIYYERSPVFCSDTSRWIWQGARFHGVAMIRGRGCVYPPSIPDELKIKRAEVSSRTRANSAKRTRPFSRTSSWINGEVPERGTGKCRRRTIKLSYPNLISRLRNCEMLFRPKIRSWFVYVSIEYKSRPNGFMEIDFYLFSEWIWWLDFFLSFPLYDGIFCKCIDVNCNMRNSWICQLLNVKIKCMWKKICLVITSYRNIISRFFN